jgi:hypothetical protein
MSAPAIFFVAVACAPSIPAAKFRRVVEQHGLLIHARQGRPHRTAYASRQVYPKIAGALLDVGAIPFGDSNRYFFVTGLATYWSKAIEDLSEIGVHLYILPTMRAIEGFPDAVADAFAAFYRKRFTDALAAAHRGSDVLPLLEVWESQASEFGAEDIRLSAEHLDLAAQIRATVAQQRRSHLPAPSLDLLDEL